MAIRTAINGFGRIGRMAFRAAMSNRDIEIVAINDLTDTATLAHLLKYDSSHGILNAEVSSTDNAITVDGREIKMFREKDPPKIPWKDTDAEYILECTGLFTEKAKAAGHLEAGAARVIISAPAKEPDITVVMGVNHTEYDPQKHKIVSNASCTTNCLAPACKVLLENFGFEKGMVTTTHAYTGDQRLLDLPHRDLRRARAAALSMIPTTTGAAKAVADVIPQLKGKLNGMAIRVPTPNVSVVDLVVQLSRPVTSAQINNAVREASEGYLKGILEYCDKPLVSIDFNGSTASSSLDALSTMVIDDMAKILLWYDNEFGYATRMIDLVHYMAGH